MIITSIIENTSVAGLPVEHGLSLYIQLKDGRNVLFDMGQSNLFIENAKQLTLDIHAVDIAVISHGHYDHGGGLRYFLEHNTKANVYLHPDSFQPHYSLRGKDLAYIGLDRELQENPRIVACHSIEKPAESMTIFSDVHGKCCCPCGNQFLFGPSKSSNDTFNHEQNLVVEENNQLILFAGCAHKGIVNIIHKVVEIFGKVPTHVFAGMHLVKSGLNTDEDHRFVDTLAATLMGFKGCKFYTMHCTGIEYFEQLKKLIGNQIEYLSCGDSVEI